MAISLGAGAAQAQDALRNAIDAEAASQARRSPLDSQDFTIKQGDFRLLMSTSLGVEWNDNVYTVNNGAEQDVVFRPMVNFEGSYPVTAYNLLHFKVGVGYDYYCDHSDLSRLRLQSGSEIGFDMFIKSVRLNLHDRFSYTQDSASNPGVAGSGEYGGLDNRIGLSADWTLKHVVLTLGYDHQNFVSSSSSFSSNDRASEMFLARAGYQLGPQLTVGVEGTTGLTSYQEQRLNDNVSYSAGVYGAYRPAPAFQVQPRFGYTIYEFQQTSGVLTASDLTGWYLDLTLTHGITKAISYALSAGHEITLGTQADTMDDWYFRPSVTWSIVKDLALTTYASYQHGTQGTGSRSAGVQNVGVSETFDWVNLGFNVNYSLTKRLSASMTYRLGLRSSDVDSRGYTQNLVGLQLTYRFE